MSRAFSNQSDYDTFISELADEAVAIAQRMASSSDDGRDAAYEQIGISAFDAVRDQSAAGAVIANFNGDFGDLVLNESAMLGGSPYGQVDAWESIMAIARAMIECDARDAFARLMREAGHDA